MRVKKFRIDEPYVTAILGLGEVYEMMSVNRLRKKLLREYEGGVLIVASNADHRAGGVSREELTEIAQVEGKPILGTGFVDTFPIPSAPRAAGSERAWCRWPGVIFLARVIFWFLLWLEPLLAGPRRSHMRYIFLGE